MRGLGTYKLKNKEIISKAILCRYNYIDTAELYKNEHIIVDAINELQDQTTINDIMINTKISKFSILDREIKKSFENRLKIFKKIGPKFKIYSILLHHPSQNCLEDWEELSELYLNNLDNVKYIGVSNYTIEQLESLKRSKYAKEVNIYCNQIEISPFCYPKQLIDYCNNNNILIIAHTSLTRTIKFDNIIIIQIANKYNMSVSTLLLLWSLYHKFIIIPKPDTIEHMLENINIYNCNIQISEKDMYILDSLDENFRFTDFDKLLPQSL